jgi:pimeloyl-ACP methyl ester carboxylesterase
MSHYLPTALVNERGRAWGKDSRAILCAEATPTGCVLFIHGFGGDAVGTWLDFPRLLPLEDECASFDCLFFGYDGLRDSVAASASSLDDLLEQLLTKPAGRVVNPSLPNAAPRRADDFQYDRVLICAHSLGAVVTRRALIDAVQRDAPWVHRLKDVRLLFFAPAHKGATILKLAEQGLAGISITLGFAKIAGSVGAAALKSRYKPLLDLEIGSQTLTDLEDETRQILGSRPARWKKYPFLRANVIHAQNDRIVLQNQFGRDYRTEFVPGKGHSAVCKPELGFLRPLEELIKRLEEVAT